MAQTAAKRAQSRMGGGGRRRKCVDSRQMELLFASAPQPSTAPVLDTTYTLKHYPADLFEACIVDVNPAKAARPRNIEALPVAANDQIDTEASALAAIVDVLIEMWREASGEDLRPTIFPRQKV